MAQTKGKYWLANNPNAEITNSEVTELGSIAETDFGVVSDLTNSAANLNAARDVFSSVTALTAAGALAVNTLYHVNDTDGASYTLPAASGCVKGDIIKCVYIAALADGEVHKYGTSGEFFANTSIVLIPGNAANAQVWTKDVADGTGDDFLNLTGATNAGWGIGTVLTFIFNGSKWHVECTGASQGTGAVAATAAFATT